MVAQQNPFTPTERADVDRREVSMPQQVRPLTVWSNPLGINLNSNLQRARKWVNGKILMKKNAQGIFEFEVTVFSARYDDTRHRWLYTLLDYKDQPIAGETPEVELG